MRIETNRVAAPQLFSHAVASYASTADLVAQAKPVITAALQRGEPVAIALRPSTERVLYPALGRPPGLVSLSRPAGPDGLSGQTVAVRRARELRELTSGGHTVTVVSEHDSRCDGVDGRFWTEFDAALNVALADLPVRLICFFPEFPLHLEVLDGARRNHPLYLFDGMLRPNPDYLPPQQVLSRQPASTPLLLGPPDVRVRFNAWQLRDVRAAIKQAATIAGFDRARTEDVILAVNEVATNAIEHGTSEAELSIWHDGNGLVCEVHDRGCLVDPLPGLRPPHPAQPRGRGLWIARQLCDVLHLWTDGEGTHVRIRASA